MGLIAAAMLLIPRLRRKFGTAILGTFTGFLLVTLISLTGFYANGKVVGEFDNGGTWIPNKSLGTALTYSLDSPTFIASYFGYSCNTTYGENCSEGVYALGFVSVEAVIVGGFVAGRKYGK